MMRVLLFFVVLLLSGCGREESGVDYAGLVKLAVVELEITSESEGLVSASFEMENAGSETVRIGNLEVKYQEPRPERMDPLFCLKTKKGEVYPAFRSESEVVSVPPGKSRVTVVFQMEEEAIRLLQAPLDSRPEFTCELRYHVGDRAYYVEGRPLRGITDS